MNNKIFYKRVIIKLSGHVLMGNRKFGIDPNVIHRIADEIKQATLKKIEIAIVIGGGNMFRGKTISNIGISRINGDYMGMLSTIINAIAIRDIFEKKGMLTEIFSAIPIEGIVKRFNRISAIKELTSGKTIIFAGGTGNPLVSTDSAASLRAVEMESDVLLKATNVDGIYNADPEKNPKAKLCHYLTYQEILKKELAVMDISAFYQCRDNNINLKIFNINKPGALLKILLGEKEGTLVSK